MSENTSVSREISRDFSALLGLGLDSLLCGFGF